LKRGNQVPQCRRCIQRLQAVAAPQKMARHVQYVRSRDRALELKRAATRARPIATRSAVLAFIPPPSCRPNTRISCEGGASRPCSGADLVSCIRLFYGVSTQPTPPQVLHTQDICSFNLALPEP
jgi:hypothetical protein